MHNLANENTPGFRRSVVQFEEHLRQALLSPSTDAALVEPRIVQDDVTPGGPDGNNVSQAFRAIWNQVFLRYQFGLMKIFHFQFKRCSP